MSINPPPTNTLPIVQEGKQFFRMQMRLIVPIFTKEREIETICLSLQSFSIHALSVCTMVAFVNERVVEQKTLAKQVIRNNVIGDQLDLSTVEICWVAL